VSQTSEIDTNVKLPAAVRAAAERSNEIIQQLNITANAPAEEEPILLPQGNELSAESLSQPTTETPPASDDDTQTWKHKFESVNGRYTRAMEQVRALTDQVQSLQNIIATMQAAPASSTTIPELSAERLITDEEAREYGEDFLNVVGKKAKEELAPLIKDYKRKIEELEERVKGVHGQMSVSTQEKMFTKMDEDLPQWRDLNRDETFLDWLALPDPYSGAIRHELLKSAFAGNDASRVLRFFKGFLAEEAAVAPAGAEPDFESTMVPKVPLQNLAAPGRAKTAAAGAPAEKPIFTRAQIAKFYADVAANKYRGRDAQKSTLEAQIFDAQREGRIR
jgi:hypothetical protein